MQKPLEIIVKVEEVELLSKITCYESLSIIEFLNEVAPGPQNGATQATSAHLCD